MTMTPSRSYLLSALHQWITDNDLTPYLAVDARVQGVMVPEQFTLDDQLVLNISYSAVQQLNIDQDGVFFNARFGGVPMNVFIPLAAALAIYARENGQGMGFGMEPGAESLMQQVDQPPEDPTPTPNAPISIGKKGTAFKTRTKLKVVK